MNLQNNFRSKIRRNSSIIAPFIGIIIIILMLSIIWYWETIGRELFLYKEVIVLNRDVSKGTVIDEDILKIKKIESDNILEEAIYTKEEIIGLEAKHFLPKETQLHINYFDSQNFSNIENAYIVRVPNEWLYSVPNTLRRKDTILFYSVNEEDNIILKTQVAYVKDSGNREVKTVSTENRLDGSSVITEVSIVATPDEFKSLESTVSKGNKLIILYAEGE